MHYSRVDTAIITYLTTSSVSYCALQVGCQSALPATLHKTILCGPMWSIFTTEYAFSYCVVCSLHTLCSLQPDNQPAKHNNLIAFPSSLERILSSICRGAVPRGASKGPSAYPPLAASNKVYIRGKTGVVSGTLSFHPQGRNVTDVAN